VRDGVFNHMILPRMPYENLPKFKFRKSIKRVRREHTPRILTISDSFKRQIFQQDDLGYCIRNKIQFLYHCPDEKENGSKEKIQGIIFVVIIWNINFLVLLTVIS
jgi:hypothetical protein